MTPDAARPPDRRARPVRRSTQAEAHGRAARRRGDVLQDRLSARLRRRARLRARRWSDAGKQVFLDLKLHDIGNTVAQGVESVARLGATFLTVHAYPQTMQAAVDARAGSSLRILAVTVLTSYDDADLAAAGYDLTVRELVAERAAQARDIGVDGLVCSAEEAARLRAIVGPGMVLVTPGIRPAGADAGDQKRIMTPAAAIAAGADYLVVGRPIIDARRSEGGGRSDRRRDRAAQAKERDMAKGYWIAQVDVSDEEGYKPTSPPMPAIFSKFGGRFLVRGGKYEAWKAEPPRNVVIEFPTTRRRSPATARPNTRATATRRRRHDADIVVVEGYDGPQPELVTLLSCAGAPAIPARHRRPTHGRHAADRDRAPAGAWAARSSRPSPRPTGVDARGRGRGRRFAGDRPRRRRARRARRRTASRSRATSRRCSRGADGLIDFTIPAATLAFAELTAARRHGPRHRHHRPLRRGRQADRARRPRAPIIVKSGNMSLGVNLLAALAQARRARRSTTTSTSRSSRCITTRRSTRRPAPR